MSTAVVMTPTPNYVFHTDLKGESRLGIIVPKDEWAKQMLFCVVEPIPGVRLKAIAWGRHIFIEPKYETGYHWHHWNVEADSIDVDDPFIQVEVLTEGDSKDITLPEERARRRQWNYVTQQYEHKVIQPERTVLSTYKHEYNEVRIGNEPPQSPWCYIKFRITVEGVDPVEAEYKFKMPTFGKARLLDDGTTVEVTATRGGVTETWQESLEPGRARYERWRGHNEWRPSNPFKTLTHHLNNSEVDDPDAWWEAFLKYVVPPDDKIEMGGLKALYKRKNIAPVLAKLRSDHPLEWMFFRWLHNERTQDKKRPNTYLATMLKTVGHDLKKLAKALKKARTKAALGVSEDRGYDRSGNWQHDATLAWRPAKVAITMTLPGAREKVANQEAKADWSKAKSLGEKADGLGIDKVLYPKLRKAVEKGEIPVNVFKNPDGDAVNQEFAIWEKALKRKGWADPIYEMAQNASRRSTYDKDITPYLGFLFRLERYLSRHTRGRAPSGQKGTKKAWKAMPKFVSSQWELEMDDEGTQNGTTKRRSAFTPVADNDARIITVPYVAVSVSGVRTQWCYSEHYHVFEEGMIDPEAGGVIQRDLEEKLNGRDDYGLMYFTLTGTVTARGYPTFLIIFERRSTHTHVHFHRVHPCRRKKGVMTQSHKLVEACYQYMAGNIPASDIEAQQGDMIYIKHPHDPIAAGAKVEKPQISSEALVFESHAMVPDAEEWSKVPEENRELRLYVSAAKTPRNRLGFLHVPAMWHVKHPEHDDLVNLEAGWYEVRRCRSYENNPVSIWSLTID